MRTIGLTGTTGHLGGGVARLLADHPLRRLGRNPARVDRVFDYATPDPAALAGLDALLFVSGQEAPDRVEQHLAVIEAIAEAGVGHVVYTSFAGAAPDATFTLARDHAATEQALRATGVPLTVLRNNLYADLLGQFADESGVLRGPAGDGRVAAVARRDVMEVAARLLERPEPGTFTLTGPEALTLDDVAAVLTESTGRPHRFEHESMEQAYASREAYGAPTWLLDAWVSTYTAIAAGELAEVTGDVTVVLGRPATALRAI